MLPSHPFLGRFLSRSPQPPQYLSLYPYGWGVRVAHTKNRPGLVRLGAFCGPSYSFPVSLFGNGIGIEIEIGIGAGVVIEIGIAIASRVVTGFVVGIVIEIVIAPVVRLDGLFCYGSSYCVGN